MSDEVKDYTIPRLPEPELLAHYVGGIGHYSGIVAKLEAQLVEAKEMQGIFRLRLKELYDPAHKRSKRK